MKAIFIMVMFCIIPGFLYPQHIPDNWHTTMPRDTATHQFGRGWSEPRDSERAAVMEAQNMAILQLASNIWVLAMSNSTRHMELDDAGIKENISERSHLMTRLILPNIRKELVLERTGDQFKAHCLAIINRRDAQAARVDMEAAITSLYAYNYFAQGIPGLEPVSIIDSLERLEEYHSWVLGNCVILFVRGANQGFYLNQLETLARMLIPDCLVFSARYKGELVRFVYGSNLDMIAQALQHHAIGFSRENSRLILTSGWGKLGELIQKNPSMVYVSGVERVHLSYDTQRRNAIDQSIFARELIRRAQHTNRNTFSLLPLPADLTVFSETEILNYIRSRDPPCRYVLVYIVETNIEPAMLTSITSQAFSPHAHPGLGYLFANASILVYDTIRGAVTFSDSIKSGLPIIRSSVIPSDQVIQRLFTNTLVNAISQSIGGQE